MSAGKLRPFFIVGHPRSGTTLLRFMLSSHPRLAVPDETGFLPFLNTDPGTDLDRPDVSTILERIGRLNRFWAGIVSDEAAFYAALPRPTLPYLLDTLYRLQVGPAAARWGDKTPLYIRYIPQIEAIFPQAQFIHVIRDGRDAALSARAKWGGEKPYMDLSYLLRNWVRNVRTGQGAGATLGPQRYHELRYEAFVAEPENTLRSLCAFLGETYDATMLDFRRTAKRAGGGIDDHTEAQEALHAESIGRWRRELTAYERRLAQAVAGPLLVDLGYEPDLDAGPPTMADRLRLIGSAVRFAVLDTTRTALYGTGLRTLNANRRR